MSTLASPLRRQLENSIKKARKIAEAGVRKSLEALAVHEPDPYQHMDEAQRKLRVQLRAQARQLGDGESQIKHGVYEIKRLVEKTAYDQWHRLLFARFLLENNLLISPEHGVSVTLDDCEELAPSQELRDAWAVAARFAAVELPEIFRADDPAGAVELPVEDRNKLVQLVKDLPVAVFTASDSLGWCYQFWQAERKAEVNAAGNKIGADELPAVTQLFTEDYMVDFLLDNTLGAWHAGKVLAANPKLSEAAQSEDELRLVVSLPGCPWKYLRFIQGQDGKWTPAAGTFDGWPKMAQELKCLDPCMGSGHFVVAMFERLVALRMAEEKLDELEAVAAVIRDNLFGLELDPRCTQIGAFNLALAAWRRVGHCTLPAMNLACSGLAPNAKKEDWLALAGANDRLQRGMERLYALFKDAPVLGSLINPRATGGDLIEADFHELQPLLEKALAQEAKDDTAHEMAVTARGLAKAAEILAGQFTLVATNVPYLGRAKQDVVLMDYCERVHPEAKADLATCFVERSIQFCAPRGSTALVTPHGWLYLDRYEPLRTTTLQTRSWCFAARLGPRAFETIGGEVVNVSLVSFTSAKPNAKSSLLGLDVSAAKSATEKALGLLSETAILQNQFRQLANPDARLVLGRSDEHEKKTELLSKFAYCYQGLRTGDSNRFIRCFWESVTFGDDWEFFQTSSDGDEGELAGLSFSIFWQRGLGQLAAYAADTREKLHDMHESGNRSWGKRGIAVGQMTVRSTWYFGEKFDNSLAAITPLDFKNYPALWTYCSSSQYRENVREISHGLYITNQSLLKVPFDLAHWQKVAAEKYPHGLPKPFSSDPTQWLFDGHSKGSDQPLQVAVARLLGYQWPRQTGSSFPDCPALAPDGLEALADKDGIVCLSASKGEAAAAERLRELLARAYGQDWNVAQQEALLAQVDYAGSTLEDWLRNGFFEQHCKLFHNRPFIWHLWDGHKNGFSALVNVHQLTHANLEKLTYAYLGDWIRRQQAAVDAGEAGSDARLQAAKHLQSALKLILEGEPPYDIFVRWKPLAQQAIGWHPDLNDGVRMNIRPFMATDIPGGKKGAGLLRAKPNIKWEKDRGKEPQRTKAEFPWFWLGSTFTGDRVNDVHLTREQKEKSR